MIKPQTFLQRVIGLTRYNHAVIAFLHDIFMAAASFVFAIVIAYFVRFGASFADIALTGETASIGLGTGIFTAVAAVVFWLMGLYRGVWRYASLDDFVAIVKAASLTILLFLPLFFFVTRLEALPRSALPLNWVLLVILLAGPRVLYRLMRDRGLYNPFTRVRHAQVPVLLAGTTDAADIFIRQMARDGDAPYRVVGIVDDNARRVGGRVRGVPILGKVDDLTAIVARLRRKNQSPQRLIVTSDTVEPTALRQWLHLADANGLTMARLPRLSDLKRSDGVGVDLHPIAIEDLLGRPQAVLDRAAMATTVAGRRVLVTGAGGTIGSELARQIAAFEPAALAVLDHSEFALYTIDLELAEKFPQLPRVTELADIRDRSRVAQVFETFRPEVVFHAAALKHVPMVELHPAEGALTNSIGTRIVADACRSHGVRLMVMISTDKAINPTSIMGATKRLAEMWCQALDVEEARRPGGGCHYVTVRFGNVLGSTGSVVPLFQRQLARGGPLTVTHPEVTRYFMTVREAVELVLQATALGIAENQGVAAEAAAGEANRGKIFVLDMGEPVRVLDLARQMIRLAGLRPEVDVKIVFTGLRPGEKLYEELFHAGEPTQPTARAGIFLGSPRLAPLAEVAAGLDALEAAARAGDGPAAQRLVRGMIPEFLESPAALKTGT